MPDFFSTLNYSSCNEDWRTERRALRIGAGDRVLAVTGSGDRPLHLLLDDPERILSVDANEAQNHLLRLKIAALAQPTERALEFLGFYPCEDRVRFFETLPLEPATREFWLRHLEAIRAGVLYEGRWERYYRGVSRLARLGRGKTIDRLFEFRNLEEQRLFVREVWDRSWWRYAMNVLCSRFFSRRFLGDPAFFAHVDPEMSVGRYIHEGMLSILDRYLARENFMLSLLFRGRLSEEDLPPYLDPRWIPALRNRFSRIQVHTEDLIDFLHQIPEGSFTRFSLSDLPSYLEPPSFNRLLAGLVRAAAPGARFCIREFLTAHRFPERPDLLREPDLEEELRREDRAFAYRFIVGTVVKS